ncbi:MAG TPA: AAA family ATPase, partial [Ktedonobacteraceae bacterium]
NVILSDQNVILSEAKNLSRRQEILRFAQNDSLVAQNDSLVAQNDSLVAQNDMPVLMRDMRQSAPVIQMVGRSREHLALVDLFEQTRQRQTCIAIISGEGGIGKTRLAQEFLGWAGAHGADILQGRAFETGGRLPYQPLVESLRPRLERENAPDDLLSDTWLAELTRLFPELRDRYPDLPAATEDETTARVRLYEAIVRLGQALAERQPVILLLDDLHWADAATLDVLYYAARRWRENHTPLMLLLNLRSDYLIEWVSALQRDVEAASLQLDALTFEETLRILEKLALNVEQRERVEVFARWLFAETGGQPLYITETLKALLERGLLARVPQGNSGWRIDYLNSMFNETTLRRFLPAGVREVIRVRLNQLAPDSFALLTAGAVLGRDASFEQLCQVAGLDEQSGLRTLDELLRTRFLREGNDEESAFVPSDNSLSTTTYFFTHDKVRDVVYSEAGEARRRIFHRHALEGMPAAPAAERAQHALAAGLRAQAFSLCVTAGDDAMLLFAVNDASKFYAQALRLFPLLPDSPAPPVTQHLYEQLGRAYELMNRAEQAESIYHDMLAHAQQTHSTAMECAALSRLAILAVQFRLDFAQANTLLQQALDRAEQVNDRALIADVEWHLAQLGFYDFDAGTIIAHSKRSLALARELGSVELMARSLNVLSYGKKQNGHLKEAESYAREAIAHFESTGNRAMQVDSMCVVADILLNQGHIEEGMALAQKALAISQEIGNAWSLVNSMYHIATALLERGNHTEALALAERCVALTEEFKLPVLQVNVYALLGIVQRASQKIEEARATHLLAVEQAQHISSPALLAAAEGELCADYALLGQWEEAAACALRVVSGKSDLFVMVLGLSRWYITEALVRAGYMQQALADLNRWQARIAESPRHSIPYLRAVAVLAHAQGETDRAASALREALEIARTLHLAEGGEP